MCNSYETTMSEKDEISVEALKKIPDSKFIQITGGEPFVRSDLEEIVDLLVTKTKRLMINTNGFFTERIVNLCKKYPDIAMRISIDGQKDVHDSIRRIQIYDNAWNTILKLHELKLKDLGISFTLQDCNYQELVPMYFKARELGIDFGTSVVHNSFYYSKDNNQITQQNHLKEAMNMLVDEQLKSWRIKDWARAFFNDISIKYIEGKPLPIKCDAGNSSFFIDVYANVLPCNMTEKPWIMGNLNTHDWNEVMSSQEAKIIKKRCRNCSINCWSVCNVQTEIRKKIWIPAWWFLKHFIKARKDAGTKTQMD